MTAVTSNKKTESQIDTAGPPASSPGRVTPRSIIIALLLTVANDYWLVQLEVVRYSYATYAAPFYNVIFTLFLLTLLNFLIKRAFPRIAFSRIELLTIYTMVSISSAVSSHCMMNILFSYMGYPAFFKTPENQWGTLFVNNLPHWLTVHDPYSLRNFYFGSSTLYDPGNYGPWVIPVLSWSIFCAVLIFTMLCLNSIMRKQWVEAERLTFPIVTLPLEMTDESGSLFRNKTMWIGFAIAGTLTFIAGLNYLYPNVPFFRITRRDMNQFIVNQPWKSVGGISVAFYFWAIGIAFLIPLELSFSCWFFFWLYKMELMFGQITGWNQFKVTGGGFDTAYPFANSQAYGAYLGYFVISMWAGRRYLWRVLRTAFLNTKEEDESREAVSYRTAILGAIAGFLFLTGFGLKMGMSLWVVILFFTFYFIITMLVCRIRAELGFPTHDLSGLGPHSMMNTVIGTEKMPVQNLIGFSLFHWFNRDYSSHPGPHQLESLKISERTHASARQMFIAVTIAGLFAMPIGFWMLLHQYYIRGGATANMEMWALAHGRDTSNALATWIKQPTPPNTTSMGFVGIGFALSMLLGWLRMSVIGFPFHPLAYAMANSWGVYQLWLPLMIGGTAKFVILRYGGLESYRKALPFFLGLILGEIVIGSLWTLLGIAFGVPTYDFWPGKYS